MRRVVFLNEILPAAPDVAVQIAHMAGETGNEQAVADQALAVFVDAIAKGEPRTRRLWFDVTQVATARTGPDRAAVIVKRIPAARDTADRVRIGPAHPQRPA